VETEKSVGEVYEVRQCGPQCFTATLTYAVQLQELPPGVFTVGLPGVGYESPLRPRDIGQIVIAIDFLLCSDGFACSKGSVLGSYLDPSLNKRQQLGAHTWRQFDYSWITPELGMDCPGLEEYINGE